MITGSTASLGKPNCFLIEENADVQLKWVKNIFKYEKIFSIF